MQKPNLFGIVIFLVCMNSLLFVGGVRVVDNDSSAFLENFVNINNNTLSVSENFSRVAPSRLQDGGSGDFLGFIDVIKTVSGFIIFMVNIVFTPIGLFTGTGLPFIFGILLGLPLLVIGVISLIYFVRSG